MNILKPSNTIEEDLTKLVVLELDSVKNVNTVLSVLKQDKIVLIRNASQVEADNIILNVAKELGLEKKLEAEAAYASISGHRKNVGKYFMTVNSRNDYQFIPAHSEGTSRTNMQLASFYAVNNTTDGGETVLLNINNESPDWAVLREVVNKCDIGNRKLTQPEIIQAKLMFNVHLPDDLLSETDTIVSEKKIPRQDIKIFNVLAPLRKSRSIILDSDCYVYWDSVASFDFDSGSEYLNLLDSSGLLKKPDESLDISILDNAHSRRVWSSGVNYSSLFKSKITRKLLAGDMIIMNNLTWAHSTSNWNPESGQRKVVAAFA